MIQVVPFKLFYYKPGSYSFLSIFDVSRRVGDLVKAAVFLIVPSLVVEWCVMLRSLPRNLLDARATI